MSDKVPARLRKIVKIAQAAGWTYDTTGKSHPRLSPPPGLRNKSGELQAPVTFALTSSDVRGDRNSCARLRRAGVDVPRSP